MKTLTVLALIFLGMILPLWFMQAVVLQAQIDQQQADRAFIARTER